MASSSHRARPERYWRRRRTNPSKINPESTSFSVEILVNLLRTSIGLFNGFRVFERRKRCWVDTIGGSQIEGDVIPQMRQRPDVCQRGIAAGIDKIGIDPLQQERPAGEIRTQTVLTMVGRCAQEERH